MFIMQIYYSILPNRRVYTFISGKVCLLASIKIKRRTLPEINVHTCLFGCIEYLHGISKDAKSIPKASRITTLAILILVDRLQRPRRDLIITRVLFLAV